MKVAFLCNSYPTKANLFNQIFIKKMKDEMETLGIETVVSYNKIFDIWGNANKVKNPIANILKYLFYIYSVLLFLFKQKKSVNILFPQGIVFSTFVSILIKRICGLPVVSYIHGGDLNKHYEKSGIVSRIIKYSLDNSDFIVANSSDIFDKVKTISSNKHVEVISPGVDLKIMRPLTNLGELKIKHNIPNDRIILLLAGNAIKRKGFDIALQSLLNINRDYLGGLQVIFLTNGPERKNLEDFINSNNLDTHVSLKDKVGPEILNEYYNIADVFVFPSRQEPLGLVGLEAMASGTPVIGSNTGGITEFVENNKTGYLFEIDNPVDLAEKIELVIQNLDKYRSNKHKIIHKANEHSLTNSAKRLVTIFQNLQNA